MNLIVFEPPDSDRSPQSSETSTPARHWPFGAFSERLTWTVTVFEERLAVAEMLPTLAPVGKRFTLAAADAEAGAASSSAASVERRMRGVGVRIMRLDFGGGPSRPASGCSSVGASRRGRFGRRADGSGTRRPT